MERYLEDPIRCDLSKKIIILSGPRMGNIVALALWREMQLLEDTTGIRVALHYLRDRDGNEIDFLAVIDGRPLFSKNTQGTSCS